MERGRPSRSGSLLEGFEVVECAGGGGSCGGAVPVPVRGPTVDRLEDILSEAISESLQPARPRCEPPVRQELTIAPEANILAHAPHDLDLYKEIFEWSSEEPTSSSAGMASVGSETLENTLPPGPETCRLVGGSKFYEVMEGGGGDAQGNSGASSPHTPTEKQDHMKPIESDDEVSDVDQECTVFNGVSYLGLATINAPKSEPEIQRIMGTLSAQRESQTGIAVSVSIPVCSQGVVVLYDATTNGVMARYAVNRISFYARGAAGSAVASCFAFTWSHGETRESAVYQCHVFRCHIAEAVQQVSSCFAKAFERIPRSMASSLVGDLSQAPSMSGSLMERSTCTPLVLPAPPMQLMHVLECTLDIKESDAKGTFSHVPKERVGFKIRGGIDKQVNVTVKQVSNNVQLTEDPATYTGGLIIERCFGVLLAPGRSVKHSDMRLLEMVSGELGGSGCSVCAMWNAGEAALSAFNVASGDGAPAHMSIGIDLVIRGIPDPLRLVIEAPVKIFPPTERFWYYSKRPLVQQFFINLKETTNNGQIAYDVASVETSGELDRSRLNLPLSLSSLLPSPLASITTAPVSPTDPYMSDGDEPLLSGTGEVSKDCCEGVLENWAQVLRSWNGPRPKALSQLVRLGVPEALRGEVWQRLADTDQYQHLMDTYRVLITKECPFDGVIQRDIARTFPAHDYFREAGGLGQDSLQRVARAYAVYDSEVGYCQGLSFLAATLLLHMPEEQAFCVLVRLMYGYGLRELYKDGFEALYMRLHQLDRLMEEQLTDLRQHFQETGMEPHMFASQWFLTLFTARFPLPLVFHIVDVFLLQGMDTLFQMALALLSKSRRDLLQLDFEGLHKYFRVTLPKKCRAEEVSRQIVKHACSVKVKRLHKYQLEFENFTKEATEKEKINVELERLKGLNSQLQQDKELLESQLLEARDATKAALKESARNAAVARDYREICARLDRQLHQIQDIVKECVACSIKLSPTDNKNACELKYAERGVEGGDGGGGGGGEKEEGGAEGQLRRRVRDLELELAQVKLAHVQAQCSNQELSHQLNTTVNEYQAALNQKQSWPPWIARTLGSIKEAAQNTKPTFQTYLPNMNNANHDAGGAGGQSPLRRQDSSPGSLAAPTSPRDTRRVSHPHTSPDARRKRDTASKRHSMLADMAPARRLDSPRELRRSQDLVPIMHDITIG